MNFHSDSCGNATTELRNGFHRERTRDTMEATNVQGRPGQTDGKTERRTSRQTNRWTDGQTQCPHTVRGPAHKTHPQSKPPHPRHAHALPPGAQQKETQTAAHARQVVQGEGAEGRQKLFNQMLYKCNSILFSILCGSK